MILVDNRDDLDNNDKAALVQWIKNWQRQGNIQHNDWGAFCRNSRLTNDPSQHNINTLQDFKAMTDRSPSGLSIHKSRPRGLYQVSNHQFTQDVERVLLDSRADGRECKLLDVEQKVTSRPAMFFWKLQKGKEMSWILLLRKSGFDVDGGFVCRRNTSTKRAQSNACNRKRGPGEDFETREDLDLTITLYSGKENCSQASSCAKQSNCSGKRRRRRSGATAASFHSDKENCSRVVQENHPQVKMEHQRQIKIRTPLKQRKTKNQNSAGRQNRPEIRFIERNLPKPKSDQQQEYTDMLAFKDAMCCIGPAGTGKTLFAVHEALVQFQEGNVDKIVLVRPTVPAGEKLGFLPGGVDEKLAPFMRPFMDTAERLLHDGKATLQAMQKGGWLEFAPIAHMRGRTFTKSFVLADEMQNADQSQLELVLGRHGEGSKTVVIGDPEQCDRHQTHGASTPIWKCFQKLQRRERQNANRQSFELGFIQLSSLDIQRSKVAAEAISLFSDTNHQRNW
jgi:phosphate starvation-inducible protein PhoH